MITMNLFNKPILILSLLSINYLSSATFTQPDNILSLIDNGMTSASEKDDISGTIQAETGNPSGTITVFNQAGFGFSNIDLSASLLIGSGYVVDVTNNMTSRYGTNSADTIAYKSNEKMRIYGKDGNDFIYPLNVETYDTRGLGIHGGAGNDWINMSRSDGQQAYGDDGDDTIVMYQGTNININNIADGGNGNDRIYGPKSGSGHLIFGGNGYDSLMLQGTGFQYQYTFYPPITTYGFFGHTTSPARYEFAYSATGNFAAPDSTFTAFDIEKIVLTSANIVNKDTLNDSGETYYLDSSTNSFTTTPSPSNIAAMPSVTMYKQSISINKSDASSFEIYINNIPTYITKIEDNASTMIDFNFMRNVTDNTGTILGQIGAKYITVPVGSSYIINLVSKKNISTTDINNIVITRKLGF